MNREDIIRMARQTDLHERVKDGVGYVVRIPNLEKLERFAALVAAPLEEEIKRLRFCTTEGDAAAAMEYLAHCVEKAVAAEREACAELCEFKYVEYDWADRERDGATACAAAIRARGQ